jgi:hypothetical protein
MPRKAQRDRRTPTAAMAVGVKVHHPGVTIRREPINSDPASEVPRDQWSELLSARREFCERKLPHDCRLLLFFIQDAAANNWLDLGGREEYIRALKLEPKMVEWALQGLQATRPDVAVEFADAVEQGKLRATAGAPEGNKNASKQNNSGNTRIESLGKANNAAYIRARLERDGHTSLLRQIEHGGTTAHAAAVEMGYRARMVQHPPTVEGYARSARRYLDPTEIAALIDVLRAEEMDRRSKGTSAS